MILILTIVFSIIAGLSKSLQDICSENSFYTSKLYLKYNFNPTFWCKSLSSKNKWKNGDKTQGELFLGSSTVFVWLTDGWHLMDSLRTLFTFLSGFLSYFIFSWFISIPLIITIILVSFELSYSWLKK